MDQLLQHLADWKPFTALVVGDFMLDQLVQGDAERLSPDAPVPILHVRSSEDRPGGAANVCMDLIALQGSVQAFGVTGADGHSRLLHDALLKEQVSCGGLIADPSRPTTVKQNLIGLAQARHPQKMFRVDYESRAPLSGKVVDHLIDAFTKALPGVSVVCLEDYDKGVCTPEVCHEIIARAKRAGVPVLVDPARIRSYQKYRGATVITPNRTEAETATGDKTQDDPAHNTKLAQRLLDELELEAVVLTLDKQGALLLERGGQPLAVPTIARQVYDVTGAGDMFLAGLAAARANKVDWPDAVRFANAAAGLEVEVFGVQPIPWERVHHAILEQTSTSKLRTLPQLLVELEARRKSSATSKLPFRVVFTNGCFDVTHAGHVALLDQAAAQGDFLVVGLNSDSSVKRLKGESRPVNSQQDRATVLGAFGCVDAVIIFDEDTPAELIRKVRPDTLVKGGDYTKKTVVGSELVESYGGRVVLVDLVPGRSTTSTIERMRES